MRRIFLRPNAAKKTSVHQHAKTPTGTTWYTNTFPAPLGRVQASPLQRQRFLVLCGRNFAAKRRRTPKNKPFKKVSARDACSRTDTT
ncbi:MAG: hypothetical protein LBQ66_07800 [Planctomycetaceae bacterium]|nr:hypothetical protein [Planctomycetaceae bacterium]